MSNRADWCILTPCGMAAINTALSIFNDPADARPWLFPADVYSGTAQYAAEVLKGQRGTNVRFTDPAGANSTTANLVGAIEEEAPALVFVEPITNPLLDVVDVPAVVRAARRQGALVVVDNTIGTPYLFKPLDAGADLVVHSATKWLAGHNDILAGVIGVNDPDLRARLLMHRNTIGTVISPDDAGRLKSELATFSLRVARQNASAAELAGYLEDHPGVARVRYAGLSSHADHAVARSLFDERGFGALITFDLARDEARLQPFRRRPRSAHPAHPFHGRRHHELPAHQGVLRNGLRAFDNQALGRRGAGRAGSSATSREHWPDLCAIEHSRHAHLTNYRDATSRRRPTDGTRPRGASASASAAGSW